MNIAQKLFSKKMLSLALRWSTTKICSKKIIILDQSQTYSKVVAYSHITLLLAKVYRGMIDQQGQNCIRQIVKFNSKWLQLNIIYPRYLRSKYVAKKFEEDGNRKVDRQIILAEKPILTTINYMVNWMQTFSVHIKTVLCLYLDGTVICIKIINLSVCIQEALSR